MPDGGWFDDEDIKIDKVETILDTNPQLYVERTREALNEKFYDNALAEAKKAYEYGNKGIEYRVLIARVLYEWGRYHKCLQWMKQSGVWKSRESDKLQRVEKDYIVSCYQDCCDKTSTPYPRELQDYLDEQIRLEEQRKAQAQQAEERRAAAREAAQEERERLNQKVEEAVGTAKDIAKYAVMFIAGVFALTLLVGIGMGIYSRLVIQPAREKEQAVYDESHNNWLSDNEMTQLENQVDQYNALLGNIQIGYYEKTYPDGTSAEEYPDFITGDYAIVTAYTRDGVHYIALYNTILGDSASDYLMQELGSEHGSSDEDYDKASQYMSIVYDYLTNMGYAEANDTTYSTDNTGVDTTGELSEESNTVSESDTGSDSSTTGDESSTKEERDARNAPEDAMYYVLEMDGIYQCFYENTDQLIPGVEPYEIDTDSGVWDSYYYYISMGGHPGVLSVSVYQTDSDWRRVIWTTTEVDYASTQEAINCMNGWGLESVDTQEKENIYHYEKFQWQDALVGSSMTNIDSWEVIFERKDNPVTQ